MYIPRGGYCDRSAIRKERASLCQRVQSLIPGFEKERYISRLRVSQAYTGDVDRFTAPEPAWHSLEKVQQTTSASLKELRGCKRRLQHTLGPTIGRISEYSRTSRPKLR